MPCPGPISTTFTPNDEMPSERRTRPQRPLRSSSSSVLIANPAMAPSIRLGARRYKRAAPIQLPSREAENRSRSPKGCGPMEKTTTPLSERLRWSWHTPEPGTAGARARQTTLAVYLLTAGSTLALAATLLGGGPHAHLLVLLSSIGYPLALWCLVRYERLGTFAWQTIAALAAAAIATGT